MIFNINSPTCKFAKGSKIILDTNILLMQFFSRYIQKNASYKVNYQNFISYCISNKLQLYTTEINIYEALHVIDKTCLDIYNNVNNKQIDVKNFHKLTAEIKKTHTEMEIFYKCVKNTIKILPNVESSKWLEEYFNTNNSLDLYDYILLKTSKENNIGNILTDDSDFISDMQLINGLNIISQNSKILNSI